MDHSQTYLKEPYVIDSNAIIHTPGGGTEEVHISRIERVDVNIDNVDDLFEGIDDTQIPNAQIKVENYDADVVNTVLYLASKYAQDSFIDKIIENSKFDYARLEDTRVTLYEAVKASKGYPFQPDIPLIRRRQTRAGDLCRKLARDIYVLTMILDGAEFDEIREVLSFNSAKSSLNASLYTPDSNETPEAKSLKKTVECLMADIVVMKEASATLANEILKEVTNLKTEISKNKVELQGEVSELRELVQANAVSIDRLCSDKSNGNACLRNEIKLINSDLKSMSEVLVAKVEKSAFVAETEKLVSLSKRVSKLEKSKTQNIDNSNSMAQSEKADSSKKFTADTHQPVRPDGITQENTNIKTYAQVVNNTNRSDKNIGAPGTRNPDAVAEKFVSQLSGIFLKTCNGQTDVELGHSGRNSRQNHPDVSRQPGASLGIPRNTTMCSRRDGNHEQTVFSRQTNGIVSRRIPAVEHWQSDRDRSWNPRETPPQPDNANSRSAPMGVIGSERYGNQEHNVYSRQSNDLLSPRIPTVEHRQSDRDRSWNLRETLRQSDIENMCSTSMGVMGPELGGNQEQAVYSRQSNDIVSRRIPTGEHRQSDRDCRWPGQPDISYSRSTPMGVDYRQTRRDDTTVHTMQQIPVRVNNQTESRPNITVNVDPYSGADDEEDFTAYVKRKVKRFYVGGFKSSMTTDKLIRYVERRGVTVTWVKMFPVRNSTRVTIRLNVEDDENCGNVLDERFWPRNVVCRPWVSWGSYRRNGPMQRDQSNYDDPE